LDKYPEKQIHITTTTLTGLKIASQIDSRIRADLAVLDVYHLRQRQLKMINPSLILIMETEIWPNMLAWAAGKQVPVVFLNARMTDKTHIRYMRFSRLVRYLGRAIKEINCQTEDDKARFEDVFGIKAEYSGNLKYALNLTDYDRMTVRKQWGYLDSDLVICFGSRRPENTLDPSVFQTLIDNTGLKLIISHSIQADQRSSELLAYGVSLHSRGEEIKPIHI
jgi:3-deoxy-D-manno-octulosonic-acid transferase